MARTDAGLVRACKQEAQSLPAVDPERLGRLVLVLDQLVSRGDVSEADAARLLAKRVAPGPES
jgi:hypothetical protein